MAPEHAINQLNLTTPFGNLNAMFSDKGLCSLKTIPPLPNLPEASHEMVKTLTLEIENYLKGNLKDFSVPLDPAGTDFQKQVWNALVEIPYGQTLTYSALAKKLNNPSARAVGTANGRNPIWIIYPCHRVIGKDGSLTGYAGGLPMKQALLKIEGAPIAENQTTLF